MAKNDLKVEVQVSMSLPDETADRCVQLLAMYLDDHPKKTLLMERDEHGKHRGRIENIKPPQAAEAGGGEAQAGAKIMDSEACKDPFQKRWEEFYAPRLGPNAEQELHQLCSRMHGTILQECRLEPINHSDEKPASDVPEESQDSSGNPADQDGQTY